MHKKFLFWSNHFRWDQNQSKKPYSTWNRKVAPKKAGPSQMSTLPRHIWALAAIRKRKLLSLEMASLWTPLGGRGNQTAATAVGIRIHAWRNANAVHSDRSYFLQVISRKFNSEHTSCRYTIQYCPTWSSPRQARARYLRMPQWRVLPTLFVHSVFYFHSGYSAHGYSGSSLEAVGQALRSIGRFISQSHKDVLIVTHLYWIDNMAVITVIWI